MIFFAATAPYLLPLVIFASLLHAPFMVPAPNAEGVIARLAAEDVSCGEDAACWRGFYSGLLDARGPAVALADLKARTLSRTPAHEYCHEILHDIGNRAYAETEDVATAYQGGDPFCRAGFYHGVLEGAFGIEGTRLLAHLDDLCRAVPGRERYSYQYFSCVHGVGHGLMAYTDGDLFRSLEGCGRLMGAWEQSSCAGGVFMENVSRESGEFSDADPHYPCSAVEERFVDACYLMQSSHILSQNGGDFAGAFSVCRGAPAARQHLCFESIGRDASAYARGDQNEAVRRCASGIETRERDHCMIGAAVDFIQGQGGEAALALCEHAEGSALCRSRVSEHIGMQ